MCVYRNIVARSYNICASSTIGIGKGLSHNRPSRWPKGGSGYVKVPDFLTFATTRVVGRQPHFPAAFTPGEILGTHF